VSDRSWVEAIPGTSATEVDLGLTWRFAQNAAFDLVGAWLFAAMRSTRRNAQRVHTRRQANDGYQAAMRVRWRSSDE